MEDTGVTFIDGGGMVKNRNIMKRDDYNKIVGDFYPKPTVQQTTYVPQMRDPGESFMNVIPPQNQENRYSENRYQMIDPTPSNDDMSCVDICNHIKSCQVCSKLYPYDKQVYSIVSSISFIIFIIFMILLVKRLMESR